ncbi:MAG: malate dehydrogenase [Gemmatimonadetes bacterium]|uniref:Malate dehydrogenase n=1 Tax=Candidatus Kutchimonas denitrificans TaxID=3056748 RepID=A0AAE4Z7Q7_9BACT|nr:malate dehydrogenase [Gemmatimonadota bacterium]NIR75203.1 malate dehydrogenase [Candidatus Kutchimonas denitrificans]NIS00141.1 malate dehydrogenase [Gemmatimonadota bacterium]NIT65733.1 malate dehydrogenase [Gemmatimonadota bacterium]NIU53011.1 malate dehydrogenase [Gemmatimonadota bacterium]
MVDRITVVGAGHVGATEAQRLAEMQVAREVVLIDILEGIPQGKALDLYESGPVLGYDTRVIGTNDYKDTKDSDLVIITAGVPRKPGMSRDDLLATNADIVRNVSGEIKKSSPEATVIVVSNPLDVMTFVTKETTGFPANRVFGMAGVLDTARYRTFIAERLQVSVTDIQALVLGGHGDTMVPLVRYTTISGIPLDQFLSKDEIDGLIDRTRKGGAEIVGYLKEGSAYYAPSAAVAQMVEAVVFDRKRILPCAAWMSGEYGISDTYLGVPCKLGRDGVEEIIEVELTGDEKAALEKSAEHVKSTIEKLENL